MTPILTCMMIHRESIKNVCSFLLISLCLFFQNFYTFNSERAALLLDLILADKFMSDHYVNSHLILKG